MYNPYVMTEIARIKVLPEVVASAIAAGEVVERPASVVKELVENALDAGADQIQVEIEQAGVARIAVHDNGRGIPAEDVVLAVERYATSKLRSAEELFQIKTLGFRGEALSSICAVSRMELTTRSSDEDRGTLLRVEAGEILEQKPIGTSPGTQVSVRDLFFNVPARRKFIKSPRTEKRRINLLVQRFALAYPHVAFRLMHDGKVTFETTGTGDERELLARIFNIDLAHEMIALPEAEGASISIRGYVSPPHLNRSNRQGITIFVNGRWIQDTSLSTAVTQAYHSLLMVGRYPITVLFIDLPPEMVDVNVHPTKAEVRFREPQDVFSLLQRAVRASLIGQAAPPKMAIPAGEEMPYRYDWQETTSADVEQQVLPMPHDREGRDMDMPLLRSVGQVSRAYLVAEGPDGIYLIDQHAAHERILFEEYMLELETKQLESQALLEPLTLEFSATEVDFLNENQALLLGLGFDIEEFGGKSFRLRRIPSIFTGKDPELALRAVVEELEEDEAPLAAKREALLAARICKKLAIKSGQVLSLEEQRELIRALESCASPRTCPHGRPTMIHLPVSTLARQFGRT